MVVTAPRVVMVVRLFHPWVGGTERQAHKLSKELLTRGCRLEVVTGWWYRGTPQREVIDTVPVFRNQTLWEFFGIRGLRKFGGYLYIFSLLWYLWRNRASYDVIHVHGLNYHTFAASIAGRWLGKRTIVKLANSGTASDIEKMRQDRQLFLARYMLPTALRCDLFVALNQMVVQELRAAGVAPARIVEMANGVETNRMAPRTDYRLRQPATIAYVGRLHAQKDIATLLRAFSRLLEDRLDIRLQLIGDGPERADLIGVAERLGISSNVDFTGIVPDTGPWLEGADMLVLPSLAEGLSNALLEAMAAGLPVVTSDIPGNARVVDHKVNGLLFPPGDVDALARAIGMLIDDEEVRCLLGQAARQTVVECFGVGRVAERYLELYAGRGWATSQVAAGRVHEGMREA
jgi:glycosyltransferase involved in cell wall biosynthesis